MRKTVVVLALAIGFSLSNVNAATKTVTSDHNDLIVSKVAVSPLCKAVATGNVEVVKALIKDGVDVNAKSNGMRPIHYAAKYNRVELIKVLITAGADVHSTCDLGYTAMGHAKKTKAKDAELFLKRFKKKAN